MRRGKIQGAGAHRQIDPRQPFALVEGAQGPFGVDVALARGSEPGTHRSGTQSPPAAGVEQRQRGQFAAREHEVAEAQFDVDMALDEALVDALVAPAAAAAAAERPQRLAWPV